MSKRNIYHLDGLTPEVKAVTFAKCSRSPESFKDIAAELTEKKSSKFHEKWVVGYGHSSVAEHATLSIALENVSILATKVIEDNRLASYTEKSTRYQVFNRHSVYKPKKIMESEFGTAYEETINFIMDTYEKISPLMHDFINKKYAEENLAKGLIQSKACDNARYMLPIATLTNLGMTANARTLEHAIRKMLSHPLDEIKEIGQEIKQVATQVCPTLVKYADYNEYIAETDKILTEKTKETLNFPEINKTNDVELVDYDKNAEEKLLTSILYKYSKYPYSQIKDKVKYITQEQKEQMFNNFHQKMSSHDWPLRELEHVNYTFDISLDYGAFRDIQRHRICTQTNQLITAEHGFSTPDELVEAGFQGEYLEVMKRAADLYYRIKEKYPFEAQYILPLAYKKRVLMSFNLRSLHHFIKLRSSKAGHISYRKIAQKCWDKVNEVHPLLAQYIRVTKD